MIITPSVSLNPGNSTEKKIVMTSSSNHQLFESLSRVSQTLRNDRCQNILYKAVFEHFKELQWIAALLLTCKSFQNSSFGANFIVNFVVDKDSIRLIESVLSPSSCFSLQFVPSLHIKQASYYSETSHRSIINFVEQIVQAKYLHSSLRSLTLYSATVDVLSFFFESSTTNAWPQLQDLTLEYCRLNDYVLEIISKNTLQLRSVNFSGNSDITDAGLESISKLSNITSINLHGCYKLTDVGLEHLSKLSNVIGINLSHCEKITDVGLLHISKLSSITSLNLFFCKEITDVGLEHMGKLSSVASLNLLGCTAITDAGLEHLSKLSEITSLNLTYCKQITDASLEHMSNLANITSLNLAYCNSITDDGLECLAKLSRLAGLDLCFCAKITVEAKRNLKIALPNCNING